MTTYVSQLEIPFTDKQQDDRRYNQMACLKWIALKEEGYEDFTLGLAKLLSNKRGVKVNAFSFAHMENLEPLKEEELQPFLDKYPAANSLYHAIRSGDPHALLVHVDRYPSPSLKRFCDGMNALKRVTRRDLETRLD